MATGGGGFGGGGFGGGGFGGGGFGGGDFSPPPKDVGTLLGILFATYVLGSFHTTAIVPALLLLGPAVTHGFLWQLVTYGFVGTPPGVWLLLSLLFLYLFGRDVFRQLGRRGFWKVLFAGIVAGGLVATGVFALLGAAGGAPGSSFALLSGQSMQLVIVITAFSVIFSHATILLFFVLPIRASWFPLIEVLFAFVSLLDTHDVPGFCGILAAIATTFLMVSGRGPTRMLRELRLRLEQRILQLRLRWLQRRRGMRVVPGGKGQGDRPGGDVRRGPWVH